MEAHLRGSLRTGSEVQKVSSDWPMETSMRVILKERCDRAEASSSCTMATSMKALLSMDYLMVTENSLQMRVMSTKNSSQRAYVMVLVK